MFYCFRALAEFSLPSILLKESLLLLLVFPAIMRKKKKTTSCNFFNNKLQRLLCMIHVMYLKDKWHPFN